jgi:hypothetical protein
MYSIQAYICYPNGNVHIMALSKDIIEIRAIVG